MWQHRLSNINERTRTALCEACGPTTIRIRNSSRSGSAKWKCNGTRSREKRERKNNSYRRHCKDHCERCPYKTRDPVLRRDLDVHHKDGDHYNDDPANLETLCANCHRLVGVKEAHSKE